ncbi:Nucleoporin_C domain-containing protein/Nucleoporin_N domain-containing protein [Cephalotus follicularis]|uniref:Nucleoporin_C domain-containing protein/Nucleoporin_N domain-containing protein n=1 Tax=Cephalotus follicularis TaxID=3775 RepID=A0A1Q3CE33_CEPFO|nr:Nucleoporin_C domain-containing protein/Nucleoporin_N domain-containing protein [Cephalotus follicularis]
MFTPGTKRRPNSRSRVGPTVTADDSPSPAANIIPNRPSTGTPAPWAPRLSVLARISPANETDKTDEVDLIKPVFVGEFPQAVRDELSSFLRNQPLHHGGDTWVSGGMDKGTCLSWIVSGTRLFIWSYLSFPASKKCTVLEIPSNMFVNGNGWLLCAVNWAGTSTAVNKVFQLNNSVGILLCNKKNRAVVYWPDIYSEGGIAPVTSFAAFDESEFSSSSADGMTSLNRRGQHGWLGSRSIASLNCLIASPVPNGQHVCVGLACSSNGELWQIYCSPSGIQCNKLYGNIPSLSSYGSGSSHPIGRMGYPRSLIWRSLFFSMEDFNREFFLLIDNAILCYSVKLCPDIYVSRLWSHEIVGTDGDLGIKKDLAGQKRIWPLDVQVDDNGRVLTILVATFCKDRVSSSSYTQYSLLTMQYKYGVKNMSDVHDMVLEKKAPIQEIIPKARVEDEEFLFTMRLRVGGKPSGSTIILSGDGTATVSHYYRNSPRLYQFDLPYDAGKVLDASTLPPADDGEKGAWVVLTEKAGIWVIPEKAVVLGGVEPPERSLSRKGSSNEGSAQEENRKLSLPGNIVPRRVSSEAWDAGDRQRAVTTGIARQTAQDEDSEALLSHLFHNFLSSEQVDGLLEKLRKSGAFERDGETNVFARTSKSIVDSLAKHWTTTRGAEIVSMAIMSSQLNEKHQKHQKFLQFLALSKCHEELCSKQRHSLQAIMEHGEKLAGIIQLRELQNVFSQKRSAGVGSHHFTSESQISGALWDLIQLVGEKARRNTVLLMDRDNAEVFYTMQYRNEHYMWYPPPEGLTPWYCQAVVRNGLWRIASFTLQLSTETSGLDMPARSDLYTCLELLTEVLLEAHTGAITAKFERGEEHKGLLDEYWNRRDTLLDSLYQQIKSFVEADNQDMNEGIQEQNEEMLRKLSSSLLSIAKRHEGYKTMWEICCDLNDSVLLRKLMHESMGPRGGFSNFVFKQLYERKQFSKLLRLGEEFPDELSMFLKYHQDLLWLHEVFVHQFSSASETLHVLALSQHEDSNSAVELTDPTSANLEPTLAHRKRFLHLAKIASMAGEDADSEIKVKRIEVDLKILKLQELLMDDQDARQQLLRPEELIKLCLKGGNPDLALRAFDVFAWTSSSFRKNNRNLLEECWRNAANQDDWGLLYQTSLTEGWSDEETLQRLRNTVLFQASSRCYGPEAETIEEGFDQVLPLRQESLEVSNNSVEAVLMQHKDFPEAGKLMLIAIMLGTKDIEADEGPSLMK